jgi:hypothetical protein
MRRPITVAVILLVVSCLGAYWLGSLQQASTNVQKAVLIDGLAVDPVHLQIGQVWEEDPLVWSLPIQNTTGTDIAIRDFNVSCACLRVEPRTLTVPAHQTVVVKMTLDARRLASVQAGLPSRPFTLEIGLVVKKPAISGPRFWVLTGIARSRVTMDELTVDFGDEVVQGQNGAPRNVLATVRIPARRLEAAANPKAVRVKVCKVSGQPARYQVQITPERLLPIGPFASEVMLFVVTDKGKHLRGPVVRVFGVVKPEVWAVPSRLLLGSRPIGETADSFVVLHAASGTRLVVEQIQTETTDVQVKPAVVESLPEGQTFRVAQKVTKAGEQASFIRFRIQRPGKELLEVPVEVSYRGEEPDHYSASTKN